MQMKIKIIGNLPNFSNFKEKKTKRLSPYVENELWQKEELLYLIKYDSLAK